jgi:hypothetical protein
LPPHEQQNLSTENPQEDQRSSTERTPMNPNPPLDIPYLSAFCRECRWMRRSPNWKERLLYRLATAHLDVLTQRAIAAGTPEPENKWQKAVRK